MNNDLISREALKKAFTSDTRNKYVFVCLSCVLETIDNAPTIEVTEEQAIDKLHETGWLIEHDKEMTERPHDKWKCYNQDNEGIHKIECPLCKYVCGSDFGDQIIMTFQKLPNYCENCGAKMDGGEEE